MTVLRHCLTVHRSVFYLLGITPYPLNKKPKPKWPQVYRLPSVLFVLINISVTIAAIYLMTNLAVEISTIFVYGDIGSVLLFLYTGSTLLINQMAVTREMLGLNSAQLLLKQCDRVEQLIKQHMFAELDWNQLRAKIVRKYCFMISAYMQTLAVYVLMAVLRKADIKLSILLYLIQAFSTMILMHTVLHTELVHFVLQSINLEMDGGKFVHVTRLQGIQRVYFEVWRTVRTINLDHGWNLVALLAVLMVDFISDVFWLFKALRMKSDYTEVTRKYVFVYSLRVHSNGYSTYRITVLFHECAVIVSNIEIKIAVVVAQQTLSTFKKY